MHVPALEDILYQSEHQTTYHVEKLYFGGTRVRGFCFRAHLHEHQKHHGGEKPWERDVERASFATSCRFHVLTKFSCREAGEDFLQQQAPGSCGQPHRSSTKCREASWSGTKHYKWGKCRRTLRHKHKFVQYLEKGFMSAARLRKPSSPSLYLFRTRTFMLQKRHVSVVTVGNFSVKIATLLCTRVFSLEKGPKNVSECGEAFIHKSQLNYNQRHHRGGMHYECGECRKILYLHIQTH